MSDKHLEDLDFLHKLKTITLEELQKLKQNHRHKNNPEWKKVAIDRAIAKFKPE